MALGPVDYGSMMTQLDLSPLNALSEQLQQRKQMRQASDLRRQQLALQEQKYTDEQADKAAYLGAVHDVVQTPTVEKFNSLILNHPQHATAAKEAFGLYSKEQGKQNLSDAIGIYGLIDVGNVPGAIQLAEKREAALESAGTDTTETKQLLGWLKSGDPEDLKKAKGVAFVGVGLADPDNFARNINAVGGDASYTLSPGSKRFDRFGNLVSESPFAPKTVKVREGERVVEYTPGGDTGGAPATGGGTLSQMLPITVHAESSGREYNPDGSRVTSPKGARGIMQMMPATAGNPGFGLKASDGTPDDDARLGRQYLAKMLDRYEGDPAKAWAAYHSGPGTVDKALQRGDDWKRHLPADTRVYVNRNMSKLSGSGGADAPRVIADGGPKAQWRMLSPAEIERRRLDPTVPWQVSPQGRISAVATPRKPAARTNGGNAAEKPPRSPENVYAPILAKVAKGQPLTAAEQTALSYYRRGAGTGVRPSARGGAPKYAEGQTATGPKGQRLVYRSGKWVEVK